MPRQAKEVEEKNEVQSQPRHTELHQQRQVSVMHVEGAEVEAVHAAGKLGVHTTRSPAGEWPFLEHRPAGVVHGQACVHRTACPGAVPKSSFQRMVAESDYKSNEETCNRQQSAHRLQP